MYHYLAMYVNRFIRTYARRPYVQMYTHYLPYQTLAAISIHYVQQYALMHSNVRDQKQNTAAYTNVH